MANDGKFGESPQAKNNNSVPCCPENVHNPSKAQQDQEKFQQKSKRKESVQETDSDNQDSVMLFQCGVSPVTFESFPNKFRIWNNSSSWFMCNTSKIC